MLGLSLLLSFWLFSGSVQYSVQLLLLSYVAVVACYGGFTATKKIWLIQFLPAVLAIITLWIAK